NLPESRNDVDSVKTQISSVEEMQKESGAGELKNESATDVSPPSPFGSSAANSQNKSPDDFFSTPFPSETSSQSPFENQSSSPLPLPFDESRSSDYRPPAPPFKESEPMFDKPLDSFNQSPFGGQAKSYNSAMQSSEWMPPPAPVSEWQNQNIGQNTPFQPPTAEGQNQTLAIVSLVLGIIGIALCQFTAPVALVTGFMARKKAEENPNEYGGSGLALAGIITGAIGTLLLVLIVIYILFIFAALFAR
ncbi:MAG TPA: DUF4190 domain-containing protein, partial [Pyrinomonadaceae bacterium]|nr:DUF4190 domain-containing protein [Pyrinomonadaceae bacterium]